MKEPKINAKDSRIIEPLFRKFPFLRKDYILFLSKAISRNQNSRKKSVKVMSEDWDYLIVLDACRYDYFEKYNFLDGELQKKVSLGCNTKEWVEKNFTDNYPDTVVISANSWLSKPMLSNLIGRNPFSYLEKVWDYGWNHKLGTVPPKKVTDATLKTDKEFPNKRKIIFYLQPHHPFIGKKKLDWLGKNFKGKHGWTHHVWNALREGQLELEEVKEAYKENLNLVLKEIGKILPNLQGKTIITSDHGNCFGEYFIYGHPSVNVKPLLEVPWFETKY